jgi:hypothetical protein
MREEIEKFWKDLSIEDKTKILKDHNCWEGMNNYLWQYLPTYVQSHIEEEFEKTRR